TPPLTIPHYPSQKPTPTITLHHPTTLPHPNTPPTLHLPLTLTYPHPTQHHLTLPLTTNQQPHNHPYQPTTHQLTKHYPTPTTQQHLTPPLTIPHYPSQKPTPTITLH
uniref:hypothetical protein n=1 Tax=Staphylococcus hominis TaxID=1290 RepID=UPI001C92C8FE